MPQARTGNVDLSAPNLLSNAVKFTNRGGKVAVTARAESGHIDRGRPLGRRVARIHAAQSDIPVKKIA